MSTGSATPGVAEHRRLRFNTIEDASAELERIVAADQAGTLRRSGNWSAGQVFGHLATWINFGYEGYPMRVPWFIRLLLRRKVREYLRDGMPLGRRIPRVEGGTYGTEPLSTDEGARRLRAAFERLAREPARYDSPAFGKLAEAQRVALNLRHAELHMGYLHPE